MFIDRRETRVAAPPELVFDTVARIGGTQGYYAADWLWVLRGWLDKLLGGPGLRRGRRDPRDLRPGEALDFWRVSAIEPGRRLELRAEMRLPGQAVLEFQVTSDPDAVTRLTQTARFRPRGLAGLAYWYAVSPLHHVVFQGMLNGIRRAAQARARHGPSASGELT